MNVYHKAEKPTFYFIGVTTEQSSIMRVFPKWAELLGLDAQRKETGAHFLSLRDKLFMCLEATHTARSIPAMIR